MKPSHVLKAMGLPANIAGCTIRISFGPQTSAADVERFLAEWRRIASASGARAA
jgi:cysteine desulfurase